MKLTELLEHRATGVVGWAQIAALAEMQQVALQPESHRAWGTNCITYNQLHNEDPEEILRPCSAEREK